MSREVARYTTEDKKKVAVAYTLLGTVKETAEQTGVPAKTIYDWVKKEWWVNLLEEAKREHQELIEARLTNIVEETTDEILDRIRNGNVKYVYNKSLKEWIELREPVNARDLAMIVDKLGNQLRVIQNKPVKITAEATFDATSLIRDFAQAAKENREKIVSEQ